MAAADTPSRRARSRGWGRGRGWGWVLTITAALLAVAWVGSVRYVLIATVTPKCQIGVTLGVIAGTLWDTPDPLVSPRKQLFLTSRDTGKQVWWFGWDRPKGPRPAWVSVWIPFWPFVLLTGVPGVWLLVKTRSAPKGHCPSCGYDKAGLPPTHTANGSAAVCPECGKVA